MSNVQMRKNKQKGLVLLLRSKQLLLYCFSIYTESVDSIFTHGFSIFLIRYSWLLRSSFLIFANLFIKKKIYKPSHKARSNVHWTFAVVLFYQDHGVASIP